MRRYIPVLIAALLASAMVVLLAPPTYAQDEGDYAGINDDYYADVPDPRDRGEARYERPYVAYTFSPRIAPDYRDEKRYDEKRDYDDGKIGYKPPYAAYAYGYQKPRKPHWRKTCVYGPLREKKVCDWEPRVCWKERECYYIYGKKYCRYYTKCKGGERRCTWIRKPYYGGPSCGERY
jgi:hypothetical protein